MPWDVLSCIPKEPRWTNKKRKCYHVSVDEGRKRVLGIMASILTAIHMPRASDLFGTPSGTPESDKLISASVQWARKIMEKIDRSLSDDPDRRL